MTRNDAPVGLLKMDMDRMIDIHIKISKKVIIIFATLLIILSSLIFCGFKNLDSNKNYDYKIYHLSGNIYCFVDDKYDNEYLISYTYTDKGFFAGISAICPRYKHDFNFAKR